MSARQLMMMVNPTQVQSSRNGTNLAKLWTSLDQTRNSCRMYSKSLFQLVPELQLLKMLHGLQILPQGPFPFCVASGHGSGITRCTWHSQRWHQWQWQWQQYQHPNRDAVWGKGRLPTLFIYLSLSFTYVDPKTYHCLQPGKKIEKRHIDPTNPSLDCCCRC